MKTTVVRIYPDTARTLKNGAAQMNKFGKTKRFVLADVIAETISANKRKNMRISYLESVVFSLERKIKDLSDKLLHQTVPYNV
jgi:hypothetical protein